jgi:hypothetical protein
MPYPGRFLLACWLAVVLTGTAVGHRHAAPARTHGLGWASLPAAPGLDDLAHRHLVLLGVELGPVTGTPDGDPDAGPRAAVGLLAVDESAPRDSTPVADVPLALPALSADDRPTEPAAADRRPAATTSCPLVTLARSGVLRS